MTNNRLLQYGFWLISALLISYISMTYIPYGVEQLSIDRATLRVLVPDTENVALWAGGSGSVGVSMLPDTAIADLTWSSADPSVAQVDENGCITAGKSGTTVLTVSGGNSVTAQVEVEVVDRVLPPGSDYPQNYKDVIMIANVDNPIGEYKPELVTVPDSFPAGRSGMQLTPETFEAYKKMYYACVDATGSGFNLLSGYRSYEKQVQLFDEDVESFMAKGYSRERAIEKTAESTQYPGCSEHQLGESADIGNTYALNYTFYNTKVGAWVTAHAHEYGFVLRYPKDKQDITKITYEAWHFRYVGVEHATYMYEHGLCVEEYVDVLRQAAQAAEDYCNTMTVEQYRASLGNAAD